ncbi:HTH domain-containing protein [Aliarcobacter butzleri]|uniref:HTH domain-containing protein n=1 Tax=Aliarcobacter butzleri TaxID=28197 RepID=UPI003AF72C1D
MTVKEAILNTLEKLNRQVTYQEVTNYIKSNKLYESDGKTLEATISALLGDFIRKNDTRVGRIKNGRTYFYYLTKNQINNKIDLNIEQKIDKKIKVDFYERDLHPLFVSYLKSQNIFSKTILHEESKNSKDETQKWVHPDIIGVKFTKLTNDITSRLLKTLEKKDSCEIISYELKKEINSDYELKKSYFQAVSNSSWANRGYLVAFDINTNLYQELERLNKAFGIGIIKLHSNPFESQILFQSAYRELDYQTIDKLCNINSKYQDIIEQIEKILNAEDRYTNSSIEELHKKCDKYFEKDEEINNYCKSKNIPIDED